MAPATLYSTAYAFSAADADVFARTGLTLSIPNLITLGRILLVPIVVWAIASGAMWIAFVLFLAAGVSDAVDGYLANTPSEFHRRQYGRELVAELAAKRRRNPNRGGTNRSDESS